MNDKTEKIDNLLHHVQTTGSGYDILRYFCLPDLLGKDSNMVLYIMGKNLARKIQFSNITEITQFFLKTGWGELTLVKENRKAFIFELKSDAISQRIEKNTSNEYRLEAGVLAEAMHQVQQKSCECTEEIKTKKQTVEFHVIYAL